MIITKTPFRISFFGGGTDYPVWYEKNGGSVLSTTINKYCYISTRYFPPFFKIKYFIRYSKREEVNKISDINHPSVRECLRYLKLKKGVEMVHTGDMPAYSGIGSSSSFTVGFLNSLYALTGKMVSKKQLAEDALHVEQKMIKENVGSQDQVAVTYGGFNRIDFTGKDKFYVQPMTIGKEKLDSLQDHLMLFFTGFSRRASDVAGEQIKKTPSRRAELMVMQDMVDEAVKILNGRPDQIKNFGKLLHESWKLKRSLTKLITNRKIDDIYDAARRAGALGGKLCGAGGGGFMILFAPPEAQPRIKEKLKKFLYVPFRFESLGSQIIFHVEQDLF